MPKPNPGETQDEFIARFMGDETMKADFPDEKQRAAVAFDTWKAAKRDHAAVEMTEEVFAVGKWNGISFSEADLDAIVSAFHALKMSIDVPLKVGHNDAQTMTDGQPALGWVSDLFRKGSKLVAVFTDVPSLMRRAFDRKLYRQKSIELLKNVEYKGKKYPFVLSGVALLGADIPAVNVLNDLGKFLASRDDALKAGGAIHFNFNGDRKMSDSEYEDLKTRLKAAEADAAKFKAEAETEKAARETERKAAEAAAFDAGKKALFSRLDTMVTDGRITPAQRDGVMKDVADGAALEKATFAADLLAENATAKETPASSGGGNSDKGDAPTRMLEFTRKIAAEEKMSFAAASIAAAQRDPALAREAMMANGTVN